MSASAGAARAAKRTKGAPRSLEGSAETALVGADEDIAASVRLNRHFASRCADLP